MQQQSQPEHVPGMPARRRWVLAGFIAIALFFLLTQHRAHLFGVLPYLLLLACPVMHLFHHHGHHGHAVAGPNAGSAPRDSAAHDAGGSP